MRVFDYTFAHNRYDMEGVALYCSERFPDTYRILRPPKKQATDNLAGAAIFIEVAEYVPDDEVWFENSEGEIVGKIVNVGSV